MHCNARSQAYPSEPPRWKRDTVQVAASASPAIGITTIANALSQSANVRSSATISRWISSFVLGCFSHHGTRLVFVPHFIPPLNPCVIVGHLGEILSISGLQPHLSAMRPLG